MGLFPGWPVDHVLFAMGACYSLLSLPGALGLFAGVPSAVMLAVAVFYSLYYLVPGFIRGASTMKNYLGKECRTEPFFNWKCYYCLCASESATPIVCAAMFYDAGWMCASVAILLATFLNLLGYVKYLIQMWYDHEYVATSIFAYLLSFMILAVCQRDPLYFILMSYPFMVLVRVPKYADMRGRKILFDEASILLHCTDHLIHGIITCSVGIYHFCGLPAILIAHAFVVPMGYFISDGTTRIQQRLANADAAESCKCK